MADRAAQSNMIARVPAPAAIDDAALALLRRRESERCVVFARWDALQPEEDAYDEEAFEALRLALMRVTSLGTEPVLCLYRGEDPAWFAARGGWQKEDNLRCYLRYVGRVVRTVGHLCAGYITFCEPNALVWEGEVHASLSRALTALSHMACTHVRAVRLVRDTRAQRGFDDTSVGIVMRMRPASELRLAFLRGRQTAGAALYERLPLLAMVRGEFHLPLRNTLRVQPGIWADFVGVTGTRSEQCAARAKTLTGAAVWIMEG